jgi:hypothetical protein
MRSDIAGFKSVRENLSLGKSTLGVASAAGEQIAEELKEIKSKVVQASNNSQGRDLIQNSIDNAMEQIKSITSAATFNGHKIHYDRAYATEVEHYPGLIVHGPLQATLLVERAVRHRGGAHPVALSHRGVHPMFEHQPLRLIGLEEGSSMRLCTATLPEHGGHQGMQVTAEWA